MVVSTQKSYPCWKGIMRVNVPHPTAQKSHHLLDVQCAWTGRFCAHSPRYLHRAGGMLMDKLLHTFNQ